MSFKYKICVLPLSSLWTAHLCIAEFQLKIDQFVLGEKMSQYGNFFRNWKH